MNGKDKMAPREVMDRLYWYAWSLLVKDDPAIYLEYLISQTIIDEFEMKTLPILIDQYGEGLGEIVAYIKKHHNDPEVYSIVGAVISVVDQS